MKAKVNRGGGFRGALNYIFDDGAAATGEKFPERVAGNMSGQNAESLSKEFGAVRRLRPDIKKPVWHCSLALPAGERLESSRWDEVANAFMAKMNFSEYTPWVAVRHNDTEYDHIHIVASRIGLDGKVWLGQWDAQKSIKATQELEKEYGLILTPGLGDAKAEKKKLKSKEINMAFRTEKEPPRQKLQRLIDGALKLNPTAFDLADSLNSAGVGVRANIASTGRMNGFSFEIDGVAFKGSDLGKGYTWSGLQKRGMSYEQARDSAGLQRFSAANYINRENSGAERDIESIEIVTNSIAGGGAIGGIAGAGPAYESGNESASSIGSARSDYGRTPSRAGRIGGGIEPEGGANIRDESIGFGSELIDNKAAIKSDGGSLQSNTDASNRAKAISGRNDESGQSINQGSGQNASEHLDESSGVNSIGNRERRISGDWASRFKQANAAKRNGAMGAKSKDDLRQSDTGGEKGNRRDIDAAIANTRAIDPTGYLESCGYIVKREGRHLSVRAHGDEVYRITQHQQGHWLWCDRHGNSGGDNIDLVQREIEPGLGFMEAVYRLSGAPAAVVRSRPSEPVRQPPQMPSETPTARLNGRGYVLGRGISENSIKVAENASMLKYADGGVLFVGYDTSGKARNVTRRAVSPDDPVQKRDLRGSDKRYPPILRGNSSSVWVVEGGMDALALHDMALRRGEQPPTVIVSGGAHVCSFIEQPHVQAILQGAAKIVIACENEKDVQTQLKADDGHKKQATRIKAVAGGDVLLWRLPPEKGKDLAEWNALDAAKAREIQERQELEKWHAERKTERVRERGMTH